MTEQRLERIEGKLDKLSDAVANFGRIEERLLSIFKRLERHEKQLDGHSVDLKELTNSVLTNSNSLKFGERLFWVVVTSGASLIVYLMR
jgi:hypothetical protein